MKTLDVLKQELADIQKSAVTKEKAKEILKVILTKQAVAVAAGRKTAFSLGGDIAGVGPMWFTKTAANPKEIEFQKKADDLYLLGTLLKTNPRKTRLFKNYSEDEEFAKVMDTEGESEWVPTQLSARLQEKIELALKVAALHDRIPMPTQPYDLPYIAGQTTAYIAGEAVDEDSPRFKKSAVTAGKVQFNAKKIAVRVLFTEELTEDSLIPILPLLKKDITKAVARAIEDATVNGDTSGTHQDTDVVDDRDARKAWMGYRKIAQATMDFNNTLSLTNLRSFRGLMGVYGVDVPDLALVCSIGGYLKLLEIEQVRTLEKYGPKATVITGELAKIDNIPIIVTEKMRDDLTIAGVYDGIDVSRTGLVLIHKPSVLYGDRRIITVKTDFDIERDQNILVCTQRLAFSTVFASTEKFCAWGYDVPKI